MAIFVATDYRITIAGTNFSDHLQSVEIPIDVDTQNADVFGTNGWKSSLASLKGFTVSLNFLQDFAAASVDDVLWPLLGTSVAMTVRPTSGGIAATNPELQFNALVTQLRPIAAQVGNIAVQQVQWQGTGAITRDVVA